MKIVIPSGWFPVFVGIVVILACDQNVRPVQDAGPAMSPPTPGVPASITGQPDGSNMQPGAAGTISGTITIKPELSSRLTGSEVLYIMARPGTGGPPIAVKRVSQLRFPVSYTLTSADHMGQGMSFAGEMTVVARIDRDGSAGSPQTGDMEGSVPQITIGQTGVDIIIDKVY